MRAEPAHQVKGNFAGDIGHRNIPFLAGDFRVAIAPHDTDIPTASGEYNRNFAGNGDVHVGNDPVISRTQGIGVQSQDVAADHDLGPGATVPFVGIALILCVDPFTDHNVDLIVFRSGYVDRAVIIDHMQARASREGLLQLIVEAVVMPEEGEIGIVANIDMITKFIPVEASRLGCHQAEADQQDEQKNSTRPDSRGPQACSCACWYSSSFITPHRISSIGHQ